MRRRLRMLEKKDYAALRAEMIEKQLRRRGISDATVLAAMTAVPRHEFVPEEVRSHAYGDLPLPIGGGQTISQPYMAAAIMPPYSHVWPGKFSRSNGVRSLLPMPPRSLPGLVTPMHMFTAATAHLACRNSLRSMPSSLPLPLLLFQSRSWRSLPKAGE